MNPVGIFGGTFDPIHYGHLLLAESCREQGKLDQVIFMPAAVPPHKVGIEQSSPEHRLEMLHLAVGGLDHAEVLTLEIDHALKESGPSFTVETLSRLRDGLGRAGSNSWAQPESPPA